MNLRIQPRTAGRGAARAASLTRLFVAVILAVQCLAGAPALVAADLFAAESNCCGLQCCCARAQALSEDGCEASCAPARPAEAAPAPVAPRSPESRPSVVASGAWRIMRGTDEARMAFRPRENDPGASTAGRGLLARISVLRV